MATRKLLTTVAGQVTPDYLTAGVSEYLNIVIAPLAEQLDLLGACRCHAGPAV